MSLRLITAYSMLSFRNSFYVKHRVRFKSPFLQCVSLPLIVTLFTTVICSTCNYILRLYSFSFPGHQTVNLTMDAPPPIPIRVISCATCGCVVQPFAACKGTSTPVNQGRIMQQCSNRTCNRTIFHTNAFPVYDYALQMAQYYNLYAPHAPPAQAASAPPPGTIPLPHIPAIPMASAPAIAAMSARPPPCPLPTTEYDPPVTSTKGAFLCAGFYCLLKPSGKTARGAQNCRFRRCSGCCRRECEDAEKQGKSRAECGAHHQSKMYAISSASHGEAAGPLQQPTVAPVSTEMAPHELYSHLKSQSVGPVWLRRAALAEDRTSKDNTQKVEKQLLKLTQHRSVRLYIWLGGGEDARIFPVYVLTFPIFVLSSASQVIAFLKLDEMAHLETWNPSDRQWELHSLSTSRRVSEDQRLLYKVILDSTSSISNDSCPGLAAELALQPHVGKWTRTGEEYVLPVPPTPPLLSTPVLSTPVSTPTATPAGSWSAQSPSSSAHSPCPPSTKSLKRKRLSRQVGGLKKACRTKGKEVVRSRVWPMQYHVSEVAEGLEYIQNGHHQGRGTIKEIYQEFYGQPMVHSTFKSNRNLWNEQISPKLKSRFIAYGKTPLGLWPRFLHTYHHDGVEPPMHQDEESDSAASDKNDHDHPRDENTDTEGSGGNGRGHRPPSLERPSPTATDCVFCGLPLPDVLSPQLHSLLEELLHPSNSYVSASNDGVISGHHHPGRGWKLRVEFCGCHVRETQVASDADGESWPSPIDIDYTLLDSHVRSLQPELARAVVKPQLNTANA
ncbi:hypothetical protein JB92DRAFT_3124817 [Gautieria morchelliformis]|nr:hypothetical protein JB92DRAFT_3124817 [Gautieria morchelliformis]